MWGDVRGVPAHGAGPVSELRTGYRAAEGEPLTFGSRRPRIDPLCRVDLIGIQASAVRARIACELCRIEHTMQRISDDPILHSIIHIASGEGGIREQLQIFLVEDRLAILVMQYPISPHQSHIHL